MDAHIDANSVRGPFLYTPTNEHGRVTWGRFTALAEEVKQAFGPEYEFELAYGANGLRCTRAPGMMPGVKSVKSFYFRGNCAFPRAEQLRDNPDALEDTYLHGFIVNFPRNIGVKPITIEGTAFGCDPWT